jgi:Growth inhibitor
MSRNGRDVRYSLVEFIGSQEDAERLSAQIIRSEGYESIDPTHPLGGRDGKKDLKCTKGGKTFIGACYFPRGQQKFTEIKKKFLKDLAGVSENNVDGFIFITNQEISDAERKELRGLSNYSVDIFHLERLIHILNEPKNFFIRLEFLDIEMTKEEMLSAFLSIQSDSSKEIRQLQESIERLERAYAQANNDKPNNGLQSKGSKSQSLQPATPKGSYRQGDVYFADLGDDEDQVSGLRPVIIVSNNINNNFSSNLTIVPITSQIKRAKLPTHVDIGRSIGLERECVALADHLRTINKRKLLKHIATLDNDTLGKIIEAIKFQIST